MKIYIILSCILSLSKAQQRVAPGVPPQQYVPQQQQYQQMPQGQQQMHPGQQMPEFNQMPMQPGQQMHPQQMQQQQMNPQMQQQMMPGQQMNPQMQQQMIPGQQMNPQQQQMNPQMNPQMQQMQQQMQQQMHPSQMPPQQMPPQQMHPGQNPGQMHPQQHMQGPGHHHPGNPQQLLNANVANEKAHIAEHLEVPMDTSKMSEQELQFHYFKMHDADNNNKLDGCELIKSLIHWHEQGSKDSHNHQNQGNEEKVFSDEELIALIDPILTMDDASKDGYIDYPEFVRAQNKANKV